MTDNPLIATIIPTYRRPQLLKRALSSVLEQTYPYFQVCVYDNASGDETEEVVREFLKKDSRVKYHCHSQNIGMIANYEYALNEVKTPYFSLLSDDDALFPWFFEEALKGLQSHPEVAFFACSTIIMSKKGKVIRVPLDLWSREGCFNPPEGLLEMISKYPIPTCILFQQKMINEVPIDKCNALTWDCDFLLQIAARYPIAASKKLCGIFLHHEDSFSNTQDFEKWKEAHRRISQRLNALDNLSDEVKNAANILINNDLKNINRTFVLRSFFAKKFKEAVDYALIYRNRYGLNATSLILLSIGKLCNYFPPAFYLFYVIRKIKKMGGKKKLTVHR